MKQRKIVLASDCLNAKYMKMYKENPVDTPYRLLVPTKQERDALQGPPTEHPEPGKLVKRRRRRKIV